MTKFKLVSWGLSIALWLCVGMLQAQQGNNPFEIVANPGTGNESVTTTSNGNPFEIVDTVYERNANINTGINGSDNPFEIKPITGDTPIINSSVVGGNNPFEINQPKKTKTKTSVASGQKKKTTTAPASQSSVERFLFYATLGLLALLTFCVTLFRTYIGRAYQAFTNDNILRQMHRESGFIVDLPYLILYTLFFFALGFFIFIYVYRNGYQPTSPFQFLLLCIGAVIGAFVLKHLFFKILASIYPIQKELGQYSFTMVIFSIMLGLLLVPIDAIIAFGAPSLFTTMTYISFGIITLVYAFRTLRGILIANRFFTNNKFHFLLYICTVEIAPILILVKIVQGL